MLFIRFVEHNDNEGETWRFYLQHDGNEEQLERLRKLMEQYHDDTDETYEFGLPVSEEEVNTLVKHSDQGYMDYENKVTGVLTLPDIENGEQLYEMLYKGGIASHFKQPEETQEQPTQPPAEPPQNA